MSSATNNGRGPSPLHDYHNQEQQLSVTYKHVADHFQRISLYQNQNGTCYTFIKTEPHQQSKLFFIDEPDFTKAFLSDLKSSNYSVTAKEKVYYEIINKQTQEAIFSEDIAYYSPRVFQPDNLNFFIKLNLYTHLHIAKTNSDDSRLSASIPTHISYLARFLPSGQISRLHPDQIEYLSLLLDQDNFLRRNRTEYDKLIGQYSNQQGQGSYSDHNEPLSREEMRARALSELKDKFSKDSPQATEFQSLLDFFKLFNIPDDFHACLFTWLTHALMPGSNQIALQIVGPRDSGKSTLQRCLKQIIDPDSKNDLDTPKTLKSLHIDAFENHLLSYDDVDEFKEVVEKGLDQLLRGTHIDVTHRYPKGLQSKFVKVRRPVIWNSLTNAVKSPKLRERVLTITLPDNQFKDEHFSLSSTDATYYLAIIIEAICYSLNSFKTANISDKMHYPPSYGDFIKIGKQLTSKESSELSSVEEELELLFIQEAKDAISASVVGDALLSYIEINGNEDRTFKMIEWSENLSSCKADGVKWPSEPNKVGAELDKLSYFFKPLGIEIYQSNEEGERLKPGTVRTNYFRTLTFQPR